MTKNTAELIWVAGIAVWYVIRFPHERRAKAATVRNSLVDFREWSALALSFLGLFLIPAVYAATGFPAPFDRSFSPMIAWLGLSVLCAALWLFRRAHADLGLNWSASLKVRTSHTLIKTGVYQYIRHPMYSSFFLLAVAQAMLLSNWIVAAVGFAGVVILFALRVCREEKMMQEFFGDDYRLYMNYTTRIIPWLI